MKVKTIFLISLVMALVTILPLAATGKQEAPPLGSETNPIVWSFVPSGEMERVSAGARQVADMLHDKTGYYFSTNVATEYVGVIEAMSTSPPKAHMASLATFAIIMATDRKVADVGLVALRRGSPSYNGQIIARTGSGIKTLADLKGKVFARVDPVSTSGWVIPMITMRAAGVNPDKDLSGILDAGSHDNVVVAVYQGQADAGGCYVDARTRVESQFPDVMEKVFILQVSIDIPNDGVQFHPSMSKEMKDKIIQALLEIAQSEDGKKALNVAYQWDGLMKADNTFYDPFRQVLQAAGVDPATQVK